MPSAFSLSFYRAYVENVQGFVLAESEIRRGINRGLKTGKVDYVSVMSRVYALLYSTYSEAAFMKMVLTPYGFTQGEVDIITAKSSIQEKWYACLDLAFVKFNKNKKGSEVPNKKLKLKIIINEFIIEPSVIRNKVAHGQIIQALNSNGKSLNPDLTAKLSDLNSVQIQRWFEINKLLCAIIEDLIESPDKGHYRWYYAKFLRLEQFIEKSTNWTIDSKVKTTSMKKKVVYKSK